MPLCAPLRATLGAQDLPRTMLSDHIEHRLFRCLKLEREERAKLSGQDADEVSELNRLNVVCFQQTFKSNDSLRCFFILTSYLNY